MLASAANERWVAQIAIAMLSAAEQTPGPPPCLLVDCGLAGSSLTALSTSFAHRGVTLHVLPADVAALRQLPADHTLGPETYARLDVPAWIAERAARTVYIDADTLSVGSVERLASAELHGATVGAVQDSRIPFVSDPQGVTSWQQLDLAPATAYFNAGVLVIDNDRWVEGRCRELVLEFLALHPGELAFADQGALNAVLANDWRPLDRRWNTLVAPAISARDSISLVARLGLWPGAGQPAEGTILHFAGRVKPWHPNYAPSIQRWLYSRAWRRYAPFATPPRHLPARSWIRDPKLYEQRVG